jgi:hypothetical protein
MPAPSHATSPQVLTLPKLLEDIQNGYLAVPRFQRPLVWSDEQRLELYRSVLDGIPIGAILQWRTSIELETYPSLGPHRLEPAASGDLIYYLLDGHQRLATLFGSLQPITPSALERLALVGDEGFATDKEWRMFFDLEEDRFHLGEKGRRPWWLPMDVVLDARRMRRFQRELERTILTEDDEHLQDKVEHYNSRADEVSIAFSQYPLPVLPFLTNKLDEAIRTFERINSQGTPMDEVHMVAALTWTQGFDFTEKVQSVRESLEELGWGELEEKVILQSCKAALDWDVTKAPPRAELQKKFKEQPELIDEVGANLQVACTFLARFCSVKGPAVLPYSIQLVLLAEAVRAGLDLDDTPRCEALSRWFWATSFAEHFAGVNSAIWKRALTHVLGMVTSADEPHLPQDINPVIRPQGRFDTRSARSRALMIHLASRCPRPWPHMEAAPDWTELIADGKSAMPKLLSTRQLGRGQANDGPENRILCPPRAWRRIKPVLLGDPYSLSLEVLESHQIGDQAAGALERGDYQRFLELRRTRLLQIEEAIVTSFGLTYQQDSGEEQPPR